MTAKASTPGQRAVGDAGLAGDLAAIGPRPVGKVLAWADPRPCFYRNSIGECGHCMGCHQRITRAALTPSALSGDAGEGLTDSLETWGQRVTAWIDEFGYDALERELCASRNTLMIWTTGRSMPRPFARQGLVRTINEYRAALPSRQGAE